MQHWSYTLAFFGFCSGAIISGAGAVLSVCTHNLQKIGTYMGMGLFIASFGTFIGPAVNGVLVDHHGGFCEVSMLSGAVTLAKGLLELTGQPIILNF